MLTREELKKIKGELAESYYVLSGFSPFEQQQIKTIAALIAEVERRQLEVECLQLTAAALEEGAAKLRAIIVANPVMGQSVQKGLGAQVLDAVADERYITPPDQRTF